jgi:hypothetical protein
MSFKFLRGSESTLLTFGHVPQAILTLRNVENVNNEFCFQFDDEEPFVFARGNSSLTINISPTIDGNISFTHNNRRFKIFAREHGDETV